MLEPGVDGVRLLRPGRPEPDDLDGGRSSVSIGVVLREGVRECESERVERRRGDFDSWANLEMLGCE
jgi:hypothetical protein